MKVTVAIDSFKGSLSSAEASALVKKGVMKADPSSQVVTLPIADGGEGTVRAIASAGGRLSSRTVTGPLGEPVEAEYCITGEGIAVIEMASAAGITLLKKEERDPMRTTTYGVGELIRFIAEEEGVRRFTVGLGGSATNDGGTGMLAALGFGLTDREGVPIMPGAYGLSELCHVDSKNVPHYLSECSFTVASDVDNPLTGERGASAVFGPQKGATPEQVGILDGYLSRFADLSAEYLGRDMRNEPGAGAAGGCGFAFLAYLGATVRPGIETVCEAVGLEAAIADSDLVITGEGRLDGQSVMGKAPVGVARIAKKYGKMTLALAGCVAAGAEECNRYGIDAFFPIADGPMTPEEAMHPENAARNLERTAEQAMRLVIMAKKV